MVWYTPCYRRCCSTEPAATKTIRNKPARASQDASKSHDEILQRALRSWLLFLTSPQLPNPSLLTTTGHSLKPTSHPYRTPKSPLTVSMEAATTCVDLS
eukprot:4802516-Amphidinium_carterae.1